MANPAADFHVSEVEITAARSEEPVTEPIPSAWDKITATFNSPRDKVDADLTQFNRDFRRGQDWQTGLIGLSTQFEPFLNADQQRWYNIDRFARAELYGVKLFDSLRTEDINIRCLAEFKVAFHTFSGGILAGMNWANVVVAGGAILACLSESEFGPMLANSDVDLFIWGLDAEAANKKLDHIHAVIASNVEDFNGSYTIERTAGAITFIPHGGSHSRNIQVVLRTYCNPAAVLAGFDLDQVCLLFDNKQVWLSLRAIRAFKTGYTTTYGAISSSFAARIVKYATRGYGVLVLPDTTERQHDHIKQMGLTARLYDCDVRDRYYRLPWTGVGNFGRVFNDVKHVATVNWTHSYSSLAALAALWKLAYKTGRIPELMQLVGTASHIYGIYEGTQAVHAFFEADAWFHTLAKFSPSLRHRTWTTKTKMWSVRPSALPSATTMSLLVILPKHLRARIAEHHRFSSLKRLRHSDVVCDASGDELEICTWTIDSQHMWQPRDGVHSAYHQFLVTAALLTAWTVWKVSTGAPWKTLFYGRCLHNAHVFSTAAALTRPGDFSDWMID
ncbi:hypothetical protein CF326_g6690 [Tilletia indica]|nr:hypothetical protein CF326_g6690 [Tilletia indica]